MLTPDSVTSSAVRLQSLVRARTRARKLGLTAIAYASLCHWQEQVGAWVMIFGE